MSSPLHALTEQVESLEPIDAPAKKVAKAVRSALGAGPVKDALSGTWLGHPLHPLLTDVVIGSFTSATVLDLVGGRDAAKGAERLVGVGLAAYPLTAVTGMSDWADAEPADEGVRRVGLVHAWTNATAFTLYGLSLRARRRGSRGAGALLGLGGAGVLAVGGYLGAHMSYAQGVGVDQTTFDAGSEDWTPVSGLGDLSGGEPQAGVAGETPVLVVERAGRLLALHDRCSHRGCSLATGRLDGDVIECTCHGSRFSLEDGDVLRGPATAPQPAFEARTAAGGGVEVRRKSD